MLDQRQRAAAGARRHSRGTNVQPGRSAMTQTTPTLLVGPRVSARSGLSPPQPGQAPADGDNPRAGAPDGELWPPDRALPADELVQTIAVLDAQVAALRARLSAAEEVVGLPVQPRRSAPPTRSEEH